MFSFLFQALHQAGVVDTYRSVNQTLLLAFDGVQYFSSAAIHCPQCAVRQHPNGAVTYSHTALTPVLVKPGLDKVIPLAPEFVRPQDGAEKQDCELNAAKRWLAAWGDDYSPLKITLLGDDLYCHEPFCREAVNRGLDFILVCKPDSHAIVAEWLAFLERGGAVKTVVRRRWTGQRREIDTYRYVQAFHGHGQRHLSSVLASLIILAFLVHTVLEWMDDQYQLLRRKLPSRQRLFGDIRTLTSYLPEPLGAVSGAWQCVGMDRFVL